MATNEELIDVGEDDEVAVDVELEASDQEAGVTAVENPNIADQLNTTAESNEAENDERTPQEKLQAYLEADESAAQYSRDVQKRINKLTYDKHEAERREKAATDYAQGVQKENLDLKSKQQHQDGVFINEHKSRVQAQLDHAKRQYKEAYELGDAELIADANQNIAQFASELTQAEQTETRFKRHIEHTPDPSQNVMPYQPEASPQYQAPTSPQIDPKAEKWATHNTWFGEDEDMTNAAMEIHQSLVMNEGYLATGDAYYTELDSRMRKNFPSKFQKPRMQGQSHVAPANNTPAGSRPNGKGKVRLSQSQVAIAKKLGVPLAEYAKYV